MSSVFRAEKKNRRRFSLLTEEENFPSPIWISKIFLPLNDETEFDVVFTGSFSFSMIEQRATTNRKFSFLRMNDTETDGRFCFLWILFFRWEEKINIDVVKDGKKNSGATIAGFCLEEKLKEDRYRNQAYCSIIGNEEKRCWRARR